MFTKNWRATFSRQDATMGRGQASQREIRAHKAWVLGESFGRNRDRE